MIFLLAASLLLISTALFYNFFWKRRNLPPGPTPLPILGNGPQFCGNNCYSAWQRWTAEYGPVFTIWIGEKPIVVITEYELIKQSFVKDANSYAGRDFLKNHFALMRGEVNGIIRTEGEQWRALREFLFRAMRNYGLERGTIERQVLEAVNGLIAEVGEEVRRGLKEHAVDQKVDQMTGSVINRMLFNFSFYGDRHRDFMFIKGELDVQQEYFISLLSLLIEQLPWLRHLPYFAQKFKRNSLSVDRTFQFCEREVQKRVEQRKGADYVPSGDILDQFLDEVDKGDPQDPHNYFQFRYLGALCYDVFLAGQETTSNTINFLVLFMMLDQSAQERLHSELDSAAREKGAELEEGQTVQFTLSDRLRIPFASAICNETLRLVNLLPLNLTKVVCRDVQVGGHRLPEGTSVVNQISTVLYDEKIFPEPMKFVPERFLDETGQLKRVEEFVPFGIGKRACPGETLGKLELLLFTANFFHKFHVYPVDPLHPPKYEKRQTFAVKLPEYKCHIVIRE